MSDLSKSERIKQIKETLRKKHAAETELRLKTNADSDASPSFNRFNKYRRSAGSEKHVSRFVKRASIGGGGGTGGATYEPKDIGNEYATTKNHTSQFSHSLRKERTSSPNTSDLNSTDEDQQDLTLRKNSNMKKPFWTEKTDYKKKPSILKIRRDEKEEGHSPSVSGGSVSFDLDPGIEEPTSNIPRTKSSESNNSCDTETGYWSGGENLSAGGGGILKSRNGKETHASSVNSDKDQKSILKDRRYSLGNPATTPTPESSLHGILKRKLSYDSSVFTTQSPSISVSSLDYCISPEPKPILKKKSSSEDLDEAEWSGPKPILKKNSLRSDHSHSSSSDGLDEGISIKPILKKSVQVMKKEWESEENLNSNRSILKGTSKFHSVDDSIHHQFQDQDYEEHIRFLDHHHENRPNPDLNIGPMEGGCQSSTNRTDSEEDILMSLSVAEKRSLFIQMEREKMGSGVSPRYDKRHTTQPVTMDEIEKANALITTLPIDQLKSNIMNDQPKELLGSMLEELSQRKLNSPNTNNQSLRGRSSSLGDASTHTAEAEVNAKHEESHSEIIKSEVELYADDPCRLSIRDRVKMFNRFARPPSPTFSRPIKRPVTSKRFQTQPITDQEHKQLLQISSPSYLIDSGCGSGSLDPYSFTSKSSIQKEDESEQNDSYSSKVHIQSESKESQQQEAEEEESEEMRFPKIQDSSDENECHTQEEEDHSFLKRGSKTCYEMETPSATPVITEKTGSIAEKIAALKTNGELNWKKRISKPSIKKIVLDDDGSDNTQNIEINTNNKDSASVVANRLSLLEKSQDGWKQRVSENDATVFTVQAKLEKAGKLKLDNHSTASSPIEKKSKILTPLKFTSKNTTALTAELEKKVLNIGKKVPSPSSKSPTSSENISSSASCSDTKLSDEDHVVRTVVSTDDESFQKFFSTAPVGPSSPTDISFDDLKTEDHKLLGVRRNVKFNRTHAANRNPVKSLLSRLPQEQTYTELKPEIREKEMKKQIQVANLSKSSHLSVEALAGLVSKEDFTAVKLKKTENQPRKLDYPYPMLIRIKGKRFVQIRIIPPIVSSLGSGDCFILITKDKVYQYIGEFSNRMEKSKLADALNHIVQKRDLGTHLSSIASVVTIDDPLNIERKEVKEFLSILAKSEKSTSSEEKLGDEADEEYEAGVIRTNRVFEVDPIKEELIPVLNEGGWGSQPKFAMLKDHRVLVFDFGSEMYIWSGCKADPHHKKIGTRLGREMFEDSYNFSEVCDEFSPLGSIITGDKRPDWCWFRKINHHMEPLLFIEKFFDWPDESGKLIRVKSFSESSTKDGSFNFTGCDVDEMISSMKDIEDPTLELEGFNVSRGSEVNDEKENRHYTITTLDVSAWRISEFSKSIVEKESLGHFYSTETYVVRWHYSVMQIGRDLKGNQSKHGGILGRARIAYFFWHGKDSKATEKGTSALMTVELDREKGPQMRVVQGKEPPAFLALFRGCMFVHLGSPEECKQRDRRLYIVLGCVESEGHFLEVPFDPSSFRSRGSFLLLDSKNINMCLWHGNQSSKTNQKIAQNGAKEISKGQGEWGLIKSATLFETEEGEEPHDFLKRLGFKTEMSWREAYTSLPKLPERDSTSQIYAWHFNSLNGILEANFFLSPKRKKNSYHSFPLLPEDLYNVQQPGLFLVLCGSDAWLWHGWRPLGDEENENMSTGSLEYRWAAERKAALETGLEFIKRLNANGQIVYAGLEPPLFRCLFPYWSIHNEARESNLDDGKVENGVISFSIGIQPFKKRTYTLEELQERPEGVDLLKLENYLSDIDFTKLLNMSRQEFGKLQQWRQVDLKKHVGLF